MADFGKKTKCEKLCIKRVSVTTTATVCKPTTRATSALLFWPAWPASSVCKPTTFVVTEVGFNFEKNKSLRSDHAGKIEI